MDASMVHFPKDPNFLTTIQKFVDIVERKLERHNEVQVEARLYKLFSTRLVVISRCTVTPRRSLACLPL